MTTYNVSYNFFWRLGQYLKIGFSLKSSYHSQVKFVQIPDTHTQWSTYTQFGGTHDPRLLEHMSWIWLIIILDDSICSPPYNFDPLARSPFGLFETVYQAGHSLALWRNFWAFWLNKFYLSRLFWHNLRINLFFLNCQIWLFKFSLDLATLPTEVLYFKMVARR